jgi:hypothetical protein
LAHFVYLSCYENAIYPVGEFNGHATLISFTTRIQKIFF